MAVSTSTDGLEERGARRQYLSRRRLLGAGAGLAASLALSVALPAASEASPIDPKKHPNPYQFAADQMPGKWMSLPMIRGAVLDVPYYSQLDNTKQGRANCGPASLMMMLATHGASTTIAEIRAGVNQFMGNYSVENGATWEALAHVAEIRGYRVVDVFQGTGYRRWSFGDLVSQTSQGNAVMTLVRYRALPGHEASTYYGNHYVVVVGTNLDGSIVYHDPAFPDAAAGAFVTVSRSRFNNAWGTVSSGIIYSGMVVQTPEHK